MEDILKRLIEAKLKGEMMNDMDLVGELPSYLYEKFKLLSTEKERFEEDLELRKRQYALELKRKLEEEFDKRNDDYERKHHEVWNEIYSKLCINPDLHYYQRNGKIYRDRSENDGKDEHDFTKLFGIERR